MTDKASSINRKPDRGQRDNKDTPGNTPSLKPLKTKTGKIIVNPKTESALWVLSVLISGQSYYFSNSNVEIIRTRLGLCKYSYLIN